MCNHNRPQVAGAILSKENKAGGITIPDCKTYFKALIAKLHGIGTRAMAVEQGNRIASLERAHVFLDDWLSTEAAACIGARKVPSAEGAGKPDIQTLQRPWSPGSHSYKSTHSRSRI